MSDMYLVHSKGPWKKHKYVKKEDGRYYYTDEYGKSYTRIQDALGYDEKTKAEKSVEKAAADTKKKLERYDSDYGTNYLDNITVKGNAKPGNYSIESTYDFTSGENTIYGDPYTSRVKSGAGTQSGGMYNRNYYTDARVTSTTKTPETRNAGDMHLGVVGASYAQDSLSEIAGVPISQFESTILAKSYHTDNSLGTKINKAVVKGAEAVDKLIGKVVNELSNLFGGKKK